MKRLIITIGFILINLYSKAQDSNPSFSSKIIKVKLVKSISFDSCKKKDMMKNAVILEFDVLSKKDKRKFGDKIYAATLCYDFPGEGVFDRQL